MNYKIKKIFTSILLVLFVFSNLGITNTLAKNDKNNTKKEFNLNDKFSGKKLERLKNSIKGKDKYKLVIKSTKTLDELKVNYANLDSNIKIKNIGDGIFSLRISKNSILANDLLGLSSGILPETIGNEEVLEPEIYEKLDTTYLSGEEVNNLSYLDKIGASTFQEELKTKDKIKVGVLDTGIDSNQDDLKNNYNTGLSYNFIDETNNTLDDNGHGTQVAGVLGAEVNGKGIYGVNSNSDLIALKVLDVDGFGTSYDVLEAIDYAVKNNIKVINLSFGGTGNPTTSQVCKSITEAKDNGIITVVSAGNTATDISNIVPAGCSDTITVGSYNKDGNKSAFSNFGTGVDIYAPGENIYTTDLNNTYITKNGTSFSTPIIAGLISKELAYNPSITYDEILNNIKNNYNLKTNLTNIISIGNLTNSGTTSSTELSLSGLTNSGTQIDLINTKYYSGYFIHAGKTYGNSLYDNTYNFTQDELKGVQIFTYNEYQTLLKNTKKDFSAMNIPTNGLVGKWNLNGNALDTSGNGNNGTPVNVTWVDSGRGDGKLVASFNGSSSYISGMHNLGLTNSLTYSVWVKSSNFSQGVGTFFGIENQNISNGSPDFQLVNLFGTSNNMYFSKAYIVHVGISAPLTFIDNTWNNLIVTYDGNIANFFKNGINIGSTYNNNQIFTTTSDIVFGRNGDGYYLNGDISQIKAYNRALSNSEIQQIYLDGTQTVNNNTSTNTPTYTYNTLITNTGLQYNFLDNNSLMCVSNKTLQSSSNTKQTKINSEGDPVNLATGEFDYENTLMSIPGKNLNYEFKLNYKNQTYYNGPVGINWDHNYNKYLTGETNGNILYYNGKLGVFRFINNSNGFDYNPGLKANLVLSGGLYQINYDSGDKEYFNTDNKLLKLEDKYQDNLLFSYSEGLLSQVTDTLGRNINYNYYDHNRLANVTDFNGRKVELTYFDGSTNSGSIYDLKEIKINNGTWSVKTINFEYTTGGDDTSNHNITKLIDSKGQTYVTNTYDINDRVASQTYGNGTITYNYTLSGTSVTKNTVTDRLGNVIDYLYNENGNNTQTKHYTASGIIDYYYTYNALGYLETEKKPAGNGIKYNYDSKGNLTEKREKADITASDSTNDIVTSYTYNDKNQVLTTNLANGVIISNTYDTAGNLNQKTTSGLETSSGAIYETTKSFGYNSNGELINSTDAKGNITNFVYSGGLLSQTTSGTGTSARNTSFTYNTYGTLTSSTDARGNTTNYELNDFNQVGTGITSEGIVSRYIYDENNNKISETKYFTGGTKTISNTYDVLDNLVSSIEDYDNSKTLTTNIQYDNNGNIIEKQTGSGAKIKYSYNEFTKLKEERIIVDSADSSKDLVTSYTYDNNLNIVSKTDAKGNTTNYNYDSYDRLIKEIKSDLSYTLYNYYKDGTISQAQNYSSSDVKLSKKVFVYNGLGKVVKEINYKDPINSSGTINTKIDYDNNGNIISKTDAKGNITNYTYDEFNNLLETQDSLGNKQVNTYDKNNNLTQKELIQTNGKTTTTNYVYDKDNKLISETNNLNKTKSYTYNELNQIISTTDEKGNITNFTYDYNGKVKSKTQVKSNGNILTSYTYDERGNNTSITDQNGNITTYTYNNLNQLVSTKYADNKEINYTYDKLGNLVSQTDPNGSITTNTYDNLNRLVSRNILAGTGVLGVNSENYSYDDLGRLVQANDSNNHKLNFSYDSLNRLISENQSGSLVNYTYDDNNNLLSITNPNGKTTSYTYDTLNRVLGISFSGTSIANYSYTGILNDEINLGNGKNVLNTFDDLNRLSSLNNGIKTYNYTYDDVSNITSDSFKNFSYDDIYRLTQVNETLSGTSLESFIYDSAGNRTYSETPIPSPFPSEEKGKMDYTVNNLNQYTSLSGTTLSGSLVYDDNGNLKQNIKYSFSYDYKNRLVKVTNSTGTISEYSYDVLGRRYEKKTSIETVNYVYSDKNILSEYKKVGNNTFKKDYVNGIGVDDVIAVNQEEQNLTQAEKDELAFCNEKVLAYSGSFIQYGWQNIIDRCNNLNSSGSLTVENTYYFNKDHLGSIVGITDNSGSLVSSYEYDSYGNASLSGSDIGNDRLFTGREFDRETELYFYRARYYDASLGRFISRDPIGQVDDVNLYGYVGENPVMYGDPMGKEKNIVINFGYYIGQNILEVLSNNLLNFDDKYKYINNIKIIHYSRNENLVNITNESQVINNNYIIYSKGKTVYHTFGEGNSNNRKYVGIDGHQEFVFKENGILETDPRNIGTYNFGNSGVEHTIYDVIPYYIWGNSEIDTTTEYDRVITKNLEALSFILNNK